MMSIGTHRLLLLLSLLLIFLGGFAAWAIQSDHGRISVKDIRFETANGVTLSALLYVPDTATASTPAPAVLAIHDYINSRETQSAYAIELARRGYVVLALDQQGHGYSDPPAFANGFGGPAGLAYLRTLPVVDTSQIVLSGHSMGGWAVLSAAAAYPDDYSAVVVSGSSTGTFGVPQGTTEFPRNFGLVFGKYDEFSATMWGARRGADIVTTEKLQTLFGTNTTVEADRLYGSLASGTARKLYQPAQTHPANHITHTGVAAVIDWVQTTSRAPHPISADHQRWQWKEAATALSLLGGILFLFVFGNLLLGLPFFQSLRQQPPKAVGIRHAGWWLSVAIIVLLPAMTFFPFQGFATTLFPTNAVFAQNLTNGFLAWALGSGFISTLLFLLWHFFLGGKKSGGKLSTYGLSWQENTVKNLSLSLLLVVVIVGVLHLLLMINQHFFLADFRIWVVALKPMNLLQFRLFLGYLIPFCLFFITIGLVLHGQLRNRDNQSLAHSMIQNALFMGGGIGLPLMLQYVPLFMGETLYIPAQALLTIVAIQFVVLLPIAGLLSTYFYRKTGHIYLGGFINGLLFTWLIVAGQATHFAF